MSEEENKNELDGTEDHKPTKGEKAAAAAEKAKSTASVISQKASAVTDSIKGTLKAAFDKVTDNKPGKFVRAVAEFTYYASWPVRKGVKYGVKYGVVEPTKLWAKACNASLKSNNKIALVGGPLVATSLLGAWFTATQYSVLYGAVAMGDRYWFGEAYETGERTGTITTLTMRGKFPCNSMEGELSMPNIRGDGSSTFPFSIRRLGVEEQEAAMTAYENGDTVSLTYDLSHWPEEWFDAENEGWFVPFLGLRDFECVQKTDANITSVTIRDGRVLPEPPRLTPGQ